MTVDHHAPPRRPCRSRARAVIWAASLACLSLFVPLMWHVHHSLRAGPAITASYLAAEHLRDDIVHANEALVSDARARVYGEAALGRDQRDALSADLAAVMLRASDAVAACGSRHHLAEVAAVQDRLRATEDRALLLLADGRRSDALRILGSPGYRADAAALRTALREYIAHCTGSLEQVRTRERAHEMQSLAWAAGIFGLCLGSWGLLLRRLDQDRHDMARSEEVRRRAESGLQEALRRYEALCSQAVEGILVVDPETGGILDANPAAAEMLGSRRDDLIGRALETFDRGPADGASRTTSPAGSAAPAGILQARRFRRCDGSLFTVEMRSSLVDAGPRAVMQCCLNGVAAGRRLADRPDDAGQLECLGRIAGGVTHDLANLLLAIKGYADLAAGRGGAGGDADLVGRIGEAAEHGLSVSQSLLAFAGREPAVIATIDLADVVARAARLLPPLLGPGIGLEVDCGAAPCRATADADRLQQVVVNLALNAAEAMPAGGRVRIALACGAAARGSQPGCRISVSDQGPGVPADLRERIWEPFYTTKPGGSRRGLGLFNVRRIVTACGGSCRVEDAPGGGARFVVTLPTAAPEPAAARAGREGPAPRVTVVEPADYARGVMAEALAEAGFVVTPLAEPAHPGDPETACDLLILDPNAPGADGALQRLSAADWAGRVILTNTPADSAQGAADAASPLVLARPFAMHELCSLAVAALRPLDAPLEAAP